MTNIIDIVRRNHDTFYNFATNKKNTTWPSSLLKWISGIFFALIFCKPSNDFMNAIICTYAILIGFSFSILFHLLSNRARASNDKGYSLERKNKIDKANKIAHELFYNISYFNILSVLLVIVALVFFLSQCHLPNIFGGLTSIQDIQPLILKIKPLYMEVKAVILFLYRVLVYILVIESIYTLFRTIGRVNFYFNQMLLLEEE